MEPTSPGQRDAVDAGMALVDEATPAALLPSSRAIAQRTGVARNTLANRFGNGDHHDVLRRLASRHGLAATDWTEALTKLLHQLAATTRVIPLMQPEGPPAAIAELAREHLRDNLAEQIAFRRQLHFTVAATGLPDPSDTPEANEDEADRRELRAALSGEYQEVTASYVPLYESVLAAWGRTMRPPFTVERMTVALTALTEGVLLRAMADEAADPDELVELYGLLVHALLLVATAPPGDDRDLAGASADLLATDPDRIPG